MKGQYFKNLFQETSTEEGEIDIFLSEIYNRK